MTKPEPVQSAQVTHHQAAQQFELRVNEMLCVLQYRLTGPKMVVLHTEVPAPIQNRGLAERLTRAALDFARGQGLKVEPRCPYTAAFMRKHREYADLL